MLAGGGGTLPPARLLLRELDAVAEVELERSPVPMIDHQQGAKFQSYLDACGTHTHLTHTPPRVCVGYCWADRRSGVMRVILAEESNPQPPW